MTPHGRQHPQRWTFIALSFAFAIGSLVVLNILGVPFRTACFVLVAFGAIVQLANFVHTSLRSG